MEYSDAPTAATAAVMTCPLCGNELPADATECDRCHWQRDQGETAEGKASDAFSLLLSILPGLGHIYKGHRVMGLFILLVITPLAVAFSLIAAVASAGWGILMLLPYWGAVMLHCWAIDDRVTPSDEGEQY